MRLVREVPVSVSHVCVPAPPGVFDGTGIWTAARVVQLAYLSLATSATVSASRRPAAAPVRRARGPCLGARLSLATRLVLRRQRQCLALIYASTSVVCVAPVVCAARGCVSLAYEGRSRKLYRLLGGPRGTAVRGPNPQWQCGDADRGNWRGLRAARTRHATPDLDPDTTSAVPKACSYPFRANLTTVPSCSSSTIPPVAFLSFLRKRRLTAAPPSAQASPS